MSQGTRIDLSEIDFEPGTVVFHDVSWEEYERLRDLDDYYRKRMTYVDGELEIMSPGMPHEVVGAILSRYVELWTFHHGIPLINAGALTFRRRDLRLGLEPDKCFWFGDAALAALGDEFDAMTDAPPQLAIEVSVSRPARRRVKFHTRLGVEEIWIWRKEKLEAYRRLDAETAEQVSESSVLPGFPLARAEALISERSRLDQTALAARFLESLER